EKGGVAVPHRLGQSARIEISRNHFKFSFRSCDPWMQLGFLASLDSCGERKLFANFLQSRRIRMDYREIFKPTAGGRIGRWMSGSCVPFNEEGKDAVVVVGQVQGFPFEHAAIGTRARTVARPFEGDTGSFESARKA